MNQNFGAPGAGQNPRQFYCESIGKEASGTDPELRQRAQVLFVATRNGVLFSALQAELVLSRGARADFLNERSIHQY